MKKPAETKKPIAGKPSASNTKKDSSEAKDESL